MKAKNRRRQHFHQAGLNHPQNCRIILLITTKAQARLQPMGDLRSEDHVLDDRMVLGYSLGSLVNGLPLKLQEEQAASLLVLQHGRRFVRLMFHSLSSENSLPCAYTGSWPMFINLWPLKMPRKTGNTAGICFERDSFCLNETFVSANSSTEGLPVLYTLGISCGWSPFYMVVIHHQESTELFLIDLL